MHRKQSLINLFSKIQKKGIRYLTRRLRQEIISPEYPLTQKFFSKINNLRSKPKLNTLKDTDILHVFYDLSFEPITFDFAFFLVDAEVYAKKNGRSRIFLWIIKKDPTLHVSYEGYTSIINEESQDWRMKNILLPLASMSPIVEGLGVIPSNFSLESYSNGNLIYPEGYSKTYRPRMDYKEIYSNLELNEFEGLISSKKATEYIKEWISNEKISLPIISITIREYGFDPIRNSKIKEWLKFADWLKERNYLPVFIPDVDSAWDSRDKFNKNLIFNEVCWNLELRMAFYNSCALNFFYSNGLSTLALLNKDIKCIVINPIVEESEMAKQEIWMGRGIKPGQRKFNFAQDFQWLSWKTDSFENIVEAFLEYENAFLD